MAPEKQSSTDAQKAGGSASYSLLGKTFEEWRAAKEGRTRQGDGHLQVSRASINKIVKTEGNVDTATQLRPAAATVPADAEGAGKKGVPSYVEPYEGEVVGLSFGQGAERRFFVVPRGIVERNLSLRECKGFVKTEKSLGLVLKDVHPDIGHTFVHYLHTGEYKALEEDPA
ncbi:hypothetical protein BDW74DRAFT_172622 [Aspergillus multicolor]|uniref:uncharacterized protein n=1 Tax=Aspergillus multicolor TaxID=41759 RepID=UPI003CCE0E8C